MHANSIRTPQLFSLPTTRSKIFGLIYFPLSQYYWLHVGWQAWPPYVNCSSQIMSNSHIKPPVTDRGIWHLLSRGVGDAFKGKGQNILVLNSLPLKSPGKSPVWGGWGSTLIVAGGPYFPDCRSKTVELSPLVPCSCTFCGHVKVWLLVWPLWSHHLHAYLTDMYGNCCPIPCASRLGLPCYAYQAVQI